MAVPLLLALLAGGFEFGRAVWHHHVVTKAMRDATRYLARMPDPTATDAQMRARNLATTGKIEPGGAPLMADWVDHPERIEVYFGIDTYDNSAGTFRGPDGQNADIQIVEGQASVKFFGGGFISLLGFPQGLTFTVRHEERHIGG